jgi:dTDP-4-amino-4,6-dideoxygalactose transaminase
MPAPSQLAIATSVVQRLIKEEASYHKELEKQQAHVQKLESNPGDDENAEYTLKQEVCLPLPLSLTGPPAAFPPPLYSLSLHT